MTAAKVPARTAARLANLRRLLAELGQRDMLRDEIRAFLNFSLWGTRKYIDDLLAGEVVVIAERRPAQTGHIGQPVYKLTTDEACIARFLEQMAQAAGERPKKPVKRQLAATSLEPGRRLHILQHDAVYEVPTCATIPAHEPLHALFWAGRLAA